MDLILDWATAHPYTAAASLVVVGLVTGLLAGFVMAELATPVHNDDDDF